MRARVRPLEEWPELARCCAVRMESAARNGVGRVFEVGARPQRCRAYCTHCGRTSEVMAYIISDGRFAGRGMSVGTVDLDEGDGA